MRKLYRWDGELQKMIEVDSQPVVESKTPFIQVDTMDALRNHADGRVYDSKSQFRRATRAAGYEELGNDKPDYHKKELVPLTSEEMLSIPKVRELLNG